MFSVIFSSFSSGNYQQPQKEISRLIDDHRIFLEYKRKENEEKKKFIHEERERNENTHTHRERHWNVLVLTVILFPFRSRTSSILFDTHKDCLSKNMHCFAVDYTCGKKMIKVKRLTNMDDHQVNDMIEIAEDDIDALLVWLNEDSLNDIEVEVEEKNSNSKHLAVVFFFESEWCVDESSRRWQVSKQ